MNDKLNQEFIPVSPSECVLVVEHTMSRGRPCMIWGPPGIGKSDIIAQIGAKSDRLVTDEQIAAAKAALDSAAAAVDTENNFSAGEIEGMARNIAMLEGALALQDAILFLDEINAAPQSVQAAAYQLILNRKVGTYHLPKGVSICAAGNRETDKAVTFRMPSALANRFIHFEMETNSDDWQDWAISNGVNADVIGYIAGHPANLFNFEPKKSGKAFATPRSWTFVSDLLTDNLSEHLNKVMVAGTVGQGLAGEFMQHVRLKGKLPNPRDIIMGKVTKLKEDKAVDVSAKYSLVIGMCYIMAELQEPTKKKSEKEWDKLSDNFLKFLMAKGHFQKEMVIMAAVTAFRRYNLDFNADTDTFNDFFNEYQEWIV